MSERILYDRAVMERFLDAPDDASFADLFKAFTPQLVAFFRGQGCVSAAEDLAQEVMFTIYRKAGQLRDRALFRSWIFKIARNALSKHHDRRTREVDTVDLADVLERHVAVNASQAGTSAFEFNHWIALLDAREREALTLRFIEEWEYHEIAAAQGTPIGTAQWRVFNAKRKLAPLLQKDGKKAAKPRPSIWRKAA
jgi:RNA polymerase sigma-70 factor (ECF subfamily)